MESEEGSRFFRRKAVLLQLSNVINELETRLFFLEGKVEVTVYSGRGKHDYTELDAARDVAMESLCKRLFRRAFQPDPRLGRSGRCKVDFTDKKAKVTRGLALGLRFEPGPGPPVPGGVHSSVREAISDARAHWCLPGGEEFVMLEGLAGSAS